MSIETWGIIGAFLAGLGALIVSVRTSLHSVTQKELEGLQKENERLLNRIETLEGKLADRDAKIEAMRDHYEAEITELQSKVDAQEVVIRELQQENILLRERWDKEHSV